MNGNFVNFAVLDSYSKDLAYEYVEAKVIEKDDVKANEIILKLTVWRSQSPTVQHLSQDEFYKTWDNYMRILERQAS